MNHQFVRIYRNILDLHLTRCRNVKQEQHITKEVRETKSGRGTIGKRKEAVEWIEAAVVFLLWTTARGAQLGRHTETGCGAFIAKHTHTHTHSSSLSKHDAANDSWPVCCNRWTTVSTHNTGKQLHGDRRCSFLLAKRSPLCVWKATLAVCVCVCVSTTLLFVPLAFLINPHSLQSGLAELNFTRSQTRTLEEGKGGVSMQHLATHRTLSPFYLPPLHSAHWEAERDKRRK